MTYKKFATDLAKQAGKIMQDNFSLGMKKITKIDGSPVTKTDLAINKLVVTAVKKYFSKTSVLGEEQSYVVKGSDLVWVCDPVDGTIPFSHGVPTCAFSLALCQQGLPILGVAYDPFLNRMFVAEKGKGTFFNGKKIKVSDNKVLKGAYISIGMPWNGMKYPMPGLIEELVFKLKGNSFPYSSVVYWGCLLAAGEIDGMVLGGGEAYDLAAVKIIIDEAGGKFTDVFGKDQKYDGLVRGCIAANKHLHKDLLRLVSKHIEVAI